MAASRTWTPSERPRSARARPMASWAAVAARSTQTTTSLAPTAAAASSAPSITRCGAMVSSSLSLWLLGSPSEPLTTTTGAPRPSRTARSLVPVGKLAPPRPRSPDRSTAAMKSSRGRPGRGGAGLTSRGRASGVPRPGWGSPPPPPMPASSRGSPDGASGAAATCPIGRGMSASVRMGGSRTGRELAGGRLWGPGPDRQPPPHRGGDRADGHAVERQHPHLPVVAADAEPVQDRQRPAGIGGPVHRPPDPMAEPDAQQAGHDQRGENVERERAQTEPERVVGRSERHHRVEPADRHVAVHHHGGDVQAQEDQRQQRQVAVQSRHDQAGPAPRGPADRGGDAEHHREGQQAQADGAAATREVPQRRCAGEDGGHAAAVSSGTGQPPTRSTCPSGRTRRVGRPSASSQPGARSPRMIAAVAAVLASTQVAAATLTVRQTTRAGLPVAGSTRWWSCWSPRRQRRAVVLEVASAPSWTRTVSPGASGPASWRSATRTDQPPAGGSPAVARSPPRLTSTPQPAARCARTAARSAASALADPPPSRHGGHLQQRAAGRGDRGEIAVVAEQPDRLADRGVDVAVGQAGGPQRHLQRLEQHVADHHRAPAGVVDHGQLGVLAEAAARPVDLRHLGGHGQAGGPEPGPVGRQHHRTAAERQEAGMSDPVHQEPPEVTLPGPLPEDGELDGDWKVEPESLEPESLELEWLLGPDPSSVVVVLPLWLALWLPLVPEKLRAAIAENPAVSASAPASSQRVRRETRRRPASRCAAAPRSEGIGVPLARRLDTSPCPRSPQAPVAPSSRNW